MKYYWVFLIIIFILILCFYHCFCREHFKNLYKGLVLFDIDGTLTTGKENFEVVQYCLDKNYAVGISTAGGIYTMENLKSFKWMPTNLYDFIVKNNNSTFNNVRSGYINGKLDKKIYEKNYNENIDFFENLGYAKGLSMDITAKNLKLQNSPNLILCDDLNQFIKGYLKYNKNYKYVFCGDKEGLSLNKINKIL